MALMEGEDNDLSSYPCIDLFESGRFGELDDD